MKKIIIGSICNIFVAQVYCSDINVCFANGQHNESNRVTLLFRHGDTGISGHENYSIAKVTAESSEEARKVGEILREGEDRNNLKFTTDCSIRGNDTAKSLSGDFLFRTSNDFFEVDLRLSRADFYYLNTQPQTLYSALDMFISNINNASESENKSNLSKINDKYGDNARAIISRFVSIVNNNRFNEMSKKMRAIAEKSNVEKNVIIHHSIFISLMIYYAKLNEIYKCSNFLELKNKIDYELASNPRETYKQCLYILGNALARYRLKNLEFVYLTVSKEKGVSNLQICDYDYIQKNNLYLSQSVTVRKKTGILRKIKSMCSLLLLWPEDVSFCENIKNVVNFAATKDAIQKKDIRLSVLASKEDKPKSWFMSLLTAPLRFIRSLHTYDDCL